MRTLVIGGARSGKSALAARWAAERAANVCTLVTGRASDPEMAERIAAHRRERPAHWKVREEPVRLGWALREELARYARSSTAQAGIAGVVLVDCLTLWVSNCLWPAESDSVDQAGWARERDDLIATLEACDGEVIIVSNEVGTGIVPGNRAARLFRDEHGWLNQAVAAVCDEVYLVTAGLPLCLKPCQTRPGHTTTLPR